MRSIRTPKPTHASSQMGMKKTPVSASTLKDRAQQPNFGNDFSSLFQETGILPQEHISNRQEPFEGYPKMQLLHELKAEHQKKHATNMYAYQCEPSQMRSTLLDWGKLHVNFDVLMIGGCVPQFDKDTLKALPIDKLSPRPSVLLLWVPAWKLDEGRHVLEHWGFRRSEDITYLIKSQKSVHAIPQSWQTADMVFKSTSWHCFLGLKGTVRRSDDNHLINCNVDTDVILEKDTMIPNIVPQEIYELVERFTLMGRRIHIVPFHAPENLPVRLRNGWVVLSPDVWMRNFDFHKFQSRVLVPVDSQIDMMRPKTPPRGMR